MSKQMYILTNKFVSILRSEKCLKFPLLKNCICALGLNTGAICWLKTEVQILLLKQSGVLCLKHWKQSFQMTLSSHLLAFGFSPPAFSTVLKYSFQFYYKMVWDSHVEAWVIITEEVSRRKSDLAAFSRDFFVVIFIYGLKLLLSCTFHNRKDGFAYHFLLKKKKKN